MKKKTYLDNQEGIGIGAIIGIVALLAVLGAVIASSLGGGSNNTASEQDKLNASAILMQSGSLKDGADLLVAKYRNADYSEIELTTAWDDVYNGTGQYGIFNGANGTLEYLVPPKDAFITSATAEWELVDATTSTLDFGGSTSTDSHFKTGELVDSVCIAINAALGLGETSSPAASDTSGRTAYCSSGTYYKALNVE